MSDFCFIGTIFRNGDRKKQFHAYFDFTREQEEFLRSVIDSYYQVVTVAPMHDTTNRYDVTDITWTKDNEYRITYDNPSPWYTDLSDDEISLLNLVPVTDDVCLSARVCENKFCTLATPQSKTVARWNENTKY